ncbi:replication-relaxation family protein [Oceanobacillus kimchii]|uniref:replication-relaxation family protein n=1 Tax=Oceanobacillus kimchii TaxID=746691 RepID=UPI00232FC667|nr:replication-relaxation family protein [Oceanobacillus kimchii]
MTIHHAKKFRDRTMTILCKLDELAVADGRQLQEICALGGTRNTNRILARIESDGYLRSFRRQQKVYVLSKKGREVIGSDRKVSSGYLEHALIRNDIYLALGMPTDWRIEAPVTYTGKYNRKYRIIPDVITTVKSRLMFIEVDRAQRIQENRKKIELYADLQARYYRKTMKSPPAVRFYTVSDVRAEKLRRIVREVNAMDVEVLKI